MTNLLTTVRTIFAACWLFAAVASADDLQPVAAAEPLLSGVRQMTFEGKRAGEGYFSPDGSAMVFQSERDPANPFYQIFLTDLSTGDLTRISPGIGKTTCAWIHPTGDRVLFASTHHDVTSVAQQQAELELRARGEQKRYSWDYDRQYELYVADLTRRTDDGFELTRLTDSDGYDAEGSYSPDGTRIVFASNRAAYEGELTADQRERFELDPSFMMDLYVADADGSNVKRLTDEAGYDGGPFFSPDGERICWRRFSPDGATAEIFTMAVDGTDVRRLTDLGAMSWAPFYHPSGDYLIFTTNRHGFANFELYLVRADGDGELVRVTHTDGFDGLPVFMPDGRTLAWTTTRTINAAGEPVVKDDKVVTAGSQIFRAAFDDDAARTALGLNDGRGDAIASEAQSIQTAEAVAKSTADGIEPADLMRHVDYLTRPELGGRMTGTPGEKSATAYVAAYLDSLGMEPSGNDGTFFQEFEFPAGSELGDGCELSVDVGQTPIDPILGKSWTPLAFSQTGVIPAAPVVWAGYGLQVPGDGEHAEYDSYVHLNVAGSWVMVLRDLPQNIDGDTRARMARYSSPRRKATVARDQGAVGIIFVTGPTSELQRKLIRFNDDSSQAEVSIAAVSIDDDLAGDLLLPAGEDLKELQSSLDDGEPAMGLGIEGVKLAAKISVIRRTGTGRNVLARLPATEGRASWPAVILGAHIDHLGRGGSNSLAGEDSQGKIHVGADDNASGVAAMLEIAQSMVKTTGRRHDVIFAAWSGEELGLFGSQAFVENFSTLYPAAPVASATEDEIAIATAHGMAPTAGSLHDAVAVYLNMDMVGRLRDKLIVQGVGSSPGFAGEVQRRNLPVGVPLMVDPTSTRLPTDASSFVARGVPILSAFTGAHEDYHTPGDTAGKLNYEGCADVAKLFGLLTTHYAKSEPPPFELTEQAESESVPRVRLTAYLGTIPDYAAGEVKGLRLSGVSKGGPAAEAGLAGGDVIVELAGRKVEDVYDYTYAIEALRVGTEVDVKIVRDGEPLTIQITPGARE